MGWLEGRVVLITGASSGIGAAVAKRFLSEGARVTTLDRKPADSDQTGADADRLVSVQGDVTHFADNERAVQRTLDAFGRLDVVVGNAGVHDAYASLAQLSSDQISSTFDDMFAVNVKAYLYLAKAALRPLVESRGSIIYTLSSAGSFADGGGPIYTASKHAAVGLVRQLAHELAPIVRVNGVSPAGTRTSLRSLTTPAGSDDRVFRDGGPSDADLRASKPLDIAPSAADHAGSYVFLASPENSAAFTGEVLHSDGGLGVRGIRRLAGGSELVDNLGRADESGLGPLPSPSALL